MTTISEAEFKKICKQIYADREQIYVFNPNIPRNEVLLWMLIACLISFLSLPDGETPCFPGAPDVEVYRQAILHVLQKRSEPVFEPQKYLSELINVE